MHDLHLSNNELWTRATILGLSDMSPAATTILAIKDCSDSPGVSYTRLFMGPIRKSQEVLNLVILVAKELDHHVRSICWDTCHLNLDVQQLKNEQVLHHADTMCTSCIEY